MYLLDVDECSVMDGACNGLSAGVYVNEMNHGYKCSCNSGFQFVTFPEEGIASCEDVDECAVVANACPDDIPHGSCINQDGSFTCGCEDGFIQSWDKKQCLESDACTMDGELCDGFCLIVSATRICGSFSLCHSCFKGPFLNVSCNQIIPFRHFDDIINELSISS